MWGFFYKCNGISSSQYKIPFYFYFLCLALGAKTQKPNISSISKICQRERGGGWLISRTWREGERRRHCDCCGVGCWSHPPSSLCFSACPEQWRRRGGNSRHLSERSSVSYRGEFFAHSPAESTGNGLAMMSTKKAEPGVSSLHTVQWNPLVMD